MVAIAETPSTATSSSGTGSEPWEVAASAARLLALVEPADTGAGSTMADLEEAR
jgi:hypothetical protein